MFLGAIEVGGGSGARDKTTLIKKSLKIHQGRCLDCSNDDDDDVK